MEKSLSRTENLYAEIFDKLESETIGEVFAKVRDSIISRIFKNYVKETQKIDEQKKEGQAEFQEEITQEIEEFNKLYEILKEESKNEKEKEKFIDSKFYELFFNTIENNNDNKENFKFLIEEFAKNFNLSELKIKEYKSFCIKFLKQRELTSLFYDLLYKSEDIFKDKFGIDLLKIAGVEHVRGKLVNEVYIKRELWELLGKIKLAPESLASIAIIDFNRIFYEIPFLNSLNLKIPNLIASLMATYTDEKSKEESEEDGEFKSVLLHERKHAKYHFKNGRRVISERIQVEESTAKKTREVIKNSKISLQEIDGIISESLLLMEEMIRDEILAQFTGYPISKITTSSQSRFLSGLSSTKEIVEEKLRISTNEYNENKNNNNIRYYQQNYLDFEFDEYIKSYSFENNIYYSSLKKRIISQLSLNKEDRKKVEFRFELQEQSLYNKIPVITGEMQRLISDYPHEKDFILIYLEEFPIREWSNELKKLKKIMTKKYKKPTL